MEMLSWKERLWITAILASVLGLVAFDVWTDRSSGASFGHLMAEALVAALALLGIVLIWSRNRWLSHEVDRLDRDLASARAEAQKWRADNAHLVQGLGEAIEKQLVQWGLTPAEKEIANLLLKGLSLKEIAEVRKTSERTVRQQTLALYRKTGLAGRAELAAYFLEDLFAPLPK